MITTNAITTENTQQEVLTVREAAELLRVNPSTVYEMCRRNELPHGRLGNAIRISRAALLAHVGATVTNEIARPR